MYPNSAPLTTVVPPDQKARKMSWKDRSLNEKIFAFQDERDRGNKVPLLSEGIVRYTMFLSDSGRISRSKIIQSIQNSARTRNEPLPSPNPLFPASDQLSPPPRGITVLVSP